MTDTKDALKKVKAAKAKLADAKEREQQLCGRRDALLDRLKNEYGFSDPAKAAEHADELEKEADDLNQQLKDELEKVDDLLEEMKERSNQ